MFEDKPSSKFDYSESIQSSNDVTSSFGFGISVDCIVLGYQSGSLRVLLVERGVSPFEGYWALPGDLMKIDENLKDAAARVLFQLTGLKEIFFKQFRTFGGVNRHPLGRVLTVGFFSLVKSENFNPLPAAWARNTKWWDIQDLPELAFDHQLIIDKGLERLRKKAKRESIGFELLPKKFTLLELQSTFEAIFGTKYDKPNFRKKILSMNILDDLEEWQTNVSHRPAKLYSFNKTKYKNQKNRGFQFEF